MQAPTASTEATLKTLAADLAAWDGTTGAARALGQRLQGAPRLEGRSEDASVRTVQILGPLHMRGTVPMRVMDQEGTDASRLLAPLLADPEAQDRWSFAEPLRISEPDAAAWLSILGEVGVATPTIERFLVVLFEARKRTLWMPAARTIARLAQRHDSVRTIVANVWRAAYPDGLPSAWEHGTLRGKEQTRGRPTPRDEVADKQRVHLLRHAFFAGCAWLAEGGAPDALGGVSAAQIAGTPLPGVDTADASAVLAGLRALLSGASTRAVVAPYLAQRFEEAAQECQGEQELRELVKTCAAPEVDAALGEALRRRLLEPRWKAYRGSARFDALWAWLLTARYFHDRGDAEAVAAMSIDAGAARPAIALAIDGVLPDGASDPVEALVPRLRTLLSPPRLATTTPEKQATCLVEAMLLFARDDVGRLSWPDLLVRTFGTDTRALPRLLEARILRHVEVIRGQEGAARRDTVAAAALADLIPALADRGIQPSMLLRGLGAEEIGQTVPPSDREAVALALAPHGGPVSVPVAIELERLCREDGTAEGQIRLLWRLLQRDPPRRTFVELLDVLRGEDTPLHRVVEAACALDGARVRPCRRRTARERSSRGGPSEAPFADCRPERHGEACDTARLRQLDERFGPFVAACVALLGSQGGAAGDEVGGGADADTAAALEWLAKGMREVAEVGARQEDVGSEDWLRPVRSFVRSDRGHGDLVSWLRWMETPSDALGERWDDLERTLRRVRELGPGLEDEDWQEARAALDAFEVALACVSWPENAALRTVVGQTRGWLADRRMFAVRARREERERRRRGREVSAQLRGWMARGDEKAVVRKLGDDMEPEVRQFLPDEDIHAACEFLLDRLRYREAHRLRKRFPERKLVLPGVFGRLVPLAVGVAGGSFLVLDVGTAWNEVIGRTGPYIASVGLSLLASLALLVGTLGSMLRTRHEGVPSAGLSLWGMVWRVTPTFLAAWVWASLVSFLVLATLRGTSVVPTEAVDGWYPILQWVLWSGLSLFLGLFLGLILQGRRLLRDGG